MGVVGVGGKVGVAEVVGVVRQVGLVGGRRSSGSGRGGGSGTRSVFCSMFGVAIENLLTMHNLSCLLLVLSFLASNS